MFDVKDLKAIKVGIASPDTIRKWSRGEVTKPETINYRSQKPEMDGLYCEKIFGPSKDYECHCGKLKKIRYQGMVCDKCGVEITSKQVRRERMGHIELKTPCTHIWYLKGIPSIMALVLEIQPKQLEEVVYFAAHVCLNPGKSNIFTKGQFLDEKLAREAFASAINEFIGDLEEGSSDYVYANDFLDSMANLSETFDFFTISRFINKYLDCEFGEGAEAIQKLLSDINVDEEFNQVYEELSKLNDKQTQKRIALKKRLEALGAFKKSGNKPSDMVLDVIPVIPPDLRPMLQLDGGRFAASDLNDLYRRVIIRNNRLKRLIDMKSPYVILMNEKRMLQEAVDSLIDNGRRNKPVTGAGGRPLKSLSSGLKGKQGRFRQNLLGKRVDYSGRSVIAVGPDLKMYQCGLPREMAIQLLRPFIASILIKRGIVQAHKQADKYIDRFEPEVFDIVEEIISEHPVLLNRAPTLHRLGIQAFQPKLVDGRAIRLHPLVCTGFNADFDGDQMAVHVPLSHAAQEEALDLMLASNNILGPKDGKPVVTPSQDMILGNYYLTLEETKEDLKARSERRAATGYKEESEKLDLYSKLEGKVFRSVEEVQLAYETKNIYLHNRIAIPGKALMKTDFSEEMNNSYLITTVGKVLFNLIFPADFPYLNDTNKDNLKHSLASDFVPKGTDIKAHIAGLELKNPFGKKFLGKIINEIFARYGTRKTSAVLDKIKDQGFKFATVAGVTISISDIKVAQGKDELILEADKKVQALDELFAEGKLTEEEKHKKILEIWTEVKNTVKNILERDLKINNRNPLFIMVDSGARGSFDNFAQLMGIRGLMSKPNGDTIELPIKSSFREGMTVSEFFIATHGARKGGADTALKTADSGYLTRRLVDVAQDVVVREEDCGTHQGFKVREIVDSSREPVKVIVPLFDRLVGRYSLNDIIDPKDGSVIIEGNHMIDEKIADTIVTAGIKEVEIRSLFGCQTVDGVCKHCYGRNLATGKEVEVGEAVGIMAAQSIGEPGTQLTMRTFHSGGVAESDITQGLPRVQELVEARIPKGEALISKIDGRVVSIETDKDKNNVATGKTAILIQNDLETIKHTANFGAKIKVAVNDNVKAGHKLTEGVISPKELLEVSNIETVENYMIKEIQIPYRSQGIAISDKHLEIIIRQMLNKVAVSHGGDTGLLPGQIIDVQEYTNKNTEALLQEKEPAVAKPLMLGITKAALKTESFLSAASFQETTKVLTDAAINGKIDVLHGLKENVITGKLIPAGRGLLTEEQTETMLDEFDVKAKMKEVKNQYIEVFDHPEEE